MSMIKCPECGSTVSTMAGTCPQCGVAIMGNLIHCSQCGTYYLKTEEQCPYCDHKEAEAEEEEEELRAEQAEEETIDIHPEENKKSPIWKILVAMACIALLGGGGYVGYQYYTEYTYRMEEKKRFEELAPLTNPDFYRQYLADYPQSIYRDEVEKRLQALTDESMAWTKTLQGGTKADLTKFLETYPGSLNSRKCLQLIDSIDWAQASETGTEQAINQYLEEHPEGMYTSEAVEFKKQLDHKKTTFEENDLIDNTINEFFTQTLTKGDKGSISESIAEPMQSFCGTSKATAQHVLKFINAKKTKNVATLKYLVGTPVTKSREKLYDNTTGFRTECTVEEIITYKSGKQKTKEKQYTATCLLNGKYKMVMIDLKENKNNNE